MITLVDPTLPYAFAKRHGVVVLDMGEIAGVGLRQGADALALVETRRALGRPLRVEGLTPAEFDRRLSDVYAAEGLGAEDDLALPSGLDGLVDDIPAADDLLDSADDAPVIRLINGVIAEAVRQGASDIHLEPYETAMLVRLRVDGVLKEALSLNPRVAPVVVSRIKVMARLDIAERRTPQDGRVSLALGGRTLDVRVSTLPSRAGERVVLRILDKTQAELPLEALGMQAEALEAFRAALREPNGVVLVTGPTGSGKTTTLYSTLKHLATPDLNVCTVEDPIEMVSPEFNQMQVQPAIDLDFAAGVRTLLRQDPDIIMVGEIRDLETAEIAVQASLTGHLVLSTLHTNSAVGAIARLRDMGVEPFLLASSLVAVIAQRLVRTLDPAEREPYQATPAELAAFGQPADSVVTLYRPRAGLDSRHAGYKGRTSIYELVPVDDTLRRLIHEGASEAEIERHARSRSASILEDGWRKCMAGVTSTEEVLRVTRED